MSRRGDCYHKAVTESFFSTVKSELAERFTSFGEAKMAHFDYIEVLYTSAVPFDARTGQPGGLRARRGGVGHGRCGKPHRTRFPTAPPILLVSENEQSRKQINSLQLSKRSDQTQGPREGGFDGTGRQCVARSLLASLFGERVGHRCHGQLPARAFLADLPEPGGVSS
jgi:hypothetical protein